jgi:hypothetical protein
MIPFQMNQEFYQSFDVGQVFSLTLVEMRRLSQDTDLCHFLRAFH